MALTMLLGFAGQPELDLPSIAASTVAPAMGQLSFKLPTQLARVQLCWVRFDGALDPCENFVKACKSEKVEGTLQDHLVKLKRATGINNVYLDNYYDMCVPLNTEIHILALAPGDDDKSHDLTVKPYLSDKGELVLDTAVIEYLAHYWVPSGATDRRRVTMKDGVPSFIYAQVGKPQAEDPEGRTPYGTLVMILGEVKDRRIPDAAKN
jgi:hypothetical protein